MNHIPEYVTCDAIQLIDWIVDTPLYKSLDGLYTNKPTPVTTKDWDIILDKLNIHEKYERDGIYDVYKLIKTYHESELHYTCGALATIQFPFRLDKILKIYNR